MTDEPRQPNLFHIAGAVAASLLIAFLQLLLLLLIWPLFTQEPAYTLPLFIAYLGLPWLLALGFPRLAHYLWLPAFTAMFFVCAIALNHPHGREIDSSALHLLGTWQEYTEPGFGFAPNTVELVINKLVWWLDAALLCFTQAWIISVLLKIKARKYHVWLWAGIALLALCGNLLAVYAERPWYSPG